MNYYLLGKRKKAKGPYSLAQLRELYKAGKIPEGTLCCEKGSKKWKPIGQFESITTDTTSGSDTFAGCVVLACLAAVVIYLPYWLFFSGSPESEGKEKTEAKSIEPKPPDPKPPEPKPPEPKPPEPKPPEPKPPEPKPPDPKPPDPKPPDPKPPDPKPPDPSKAIRDAEYDLLKRLGGLEKQLGEITPGKTEGWLEFAHVYIYRAAEFKTDARGAALLKAQSMLYRGGGSLEIQDEPRRAFQLYAAAEAVAAIANTVVTDDTYKKLIMQNNQDVENLKQRLLAGRLRNISTNLLQTIYNGDFNKVYRMYRHEQEPGK